MIVDPPPTPKELEDLRQALRHNIPEADYVNNLGFYETWLQYLIGLRRSYQRKWLTEAYNEQSSGS